MNYSSAVFLGAPAWMGHRTIPFGPTIPRRQSTSSHSRHVRFVDPPAAHPRASNHSSRGNSGHQSSRGSSSTAANYGGSVRGGPSARHEPSRHSRGRSTEPNSTVANYGGSVRGGPSARCSSRNPSRHSRDEPSSGARRSRGHSPMPVGHPWGFSTVRMPISRNRTACRYAYECEEVEQVSRQYYAPRR